MRKLTILITIAGLLSLTACVNDPAENEDENAPDVSEHEEYDELDGTPPLVETVSLCELVSDYDRAGVVEIDTIYGIDGEEFPDDQGWYLEFTLVDSWFGDLDDSEDLRTSGGPYGDAYASPPISLETGEEIAVFLREDGNSIMNELATFRSDDNDLFTNTMHFREEPIALDALQDYIVDIHDAAVAGEDCPVDADLGLDRYPADDG